MGLPGHPVDDLQVERDCDPEGTGALEGAIVEAAAHPEPTAERIEGYPWNNHHVDVFDGHEGAVWTGLGEAPGTADGGSPAAELQRQGAADNDWPDRSRHGDREGGDIHLTGKRVVQQHGAGLL